MDNYTLKLHILDCNLEYDGNPPNDGNLLIFCHIQNHDDLNFKSKSVELNSNPQFDEKFEIPVYDPQNDNLIIEIHQQDSNSENNFCSPITFPLKNIEIEAKSTEKTSISLYNNDQKIGSLNLDLQLQSKETQSINNAINYPVLLRINIIQVPNILKQNLAENDGEEEEKDENDIYLTFLLQGHDENELIKSIINKKSLNPSWNQSFSLVCNDPRNDILNIKMISSGKVLLDQKLEVNKIEPNDPSHLNLSFGEDIVSGPLLINFSISNLSKIAKSIVKIHVKILEGHELKKMLLGKTNPYAKISVGDKEATTNVKKATINPEWNQEFDFVSTDPINDKLILQLFHKTKKTSADHKMTDPICIPIRDLNLTSDKQSIHYDVPISLKKSCAAIYPLKFILKLRIL